MRGANNWLSIAYTFRLLIFLLMLSFNLYASTADIKCSDYCDNGTDIGYSISSDDVCHCISEKDAYLDKAIEAIGIRPEEEYDSYDWSLYDNSRSLSLDQIKDN